MSYEIERQTKKIERKWRGLRKKTIVSTEPQGVLKEGETTDLFITEGEKVGTATLTGGTLAVTPEGNVVVDMGNILGFQSSASYVEDGIEKTVWIGTVSTSEDLTLRREDGSHAILLKRLAKGGANT